MMLKEILADRSLKAKEKAEIIATQLIKGTIDSNTLIDIASNQKDTAKGICLEACEYAVCVHPDCATAKLVDFAIHSLHEKAPKVKWEAAKVIGSCIARFPTRIDAAIPPLLEQSEHSGTVVRWSAAFALSQILLAQTPVNSELIPAVHAIVKREEKNSIRKIYEAALKKAARV